MQQSSNLWKTLGYYGFIYLILMAIVGGGYSLAQQYAKPIAALIFPINEGNSLLKSLMVISGMYWGAVLLMMVSSKKSQ